MKQALPQARPHRGNWVQTERAAHEAWARLIVKAPKAAAVMHLLTARVGEHNGVVISHKTLASLLGVKSVTTIKTALAVLEADRWIEIRQIGQNGTVNAYIVNDRVAWAKGRDGIRYSLFSATVIVSSDEQPDQNKLKPQELLRRVPVLSAGERQLPAGPGLPPESQLFFEGVESDLPASEREGRGEP